MALPHPLPDDLVELIARRFRVLGEPMRIKLLDRLRDGRGERQRAHRRARRLTAERLQAPHRPGRRRHPRPPQAGNARLLPDRRRGRLRALRPGLRLGRAAAASPERARRRGRPVTAVAAPAQPPHRRPRSRRRSARSAGSAAGRPTTSGRSRSPGWSSPSRSVRSRRRSRRRSPEPAGRRTAPSRCRRATLIQANFAGLSSSALMVVVHSQGLTAGDAAFRQTIGRVDQLLRANEHVGSVVSAARRLEHLRGRPHRRRDRRRQGRPDGDGRRRRRR